jgi:NADPH2:quinone reductase
MTRAIVVREYGDAEKLRLEEIEVGKPGPGELRIRQTAIGVNFHDVYVRSGSYQTLKLPGIPGIEAAGVIEETGEGASGFRSGERIVYVTSRYGAYAQARLLPAALALKLPAELSDEAAASVTLKGLTACMLLRRVYRVAAGETVLIHAGAGGVGQLLVRWAKALGARVLATAGSAEKAAIAKECGADHVILYREENFPDRVRELTGGAGVDVVYDSVGKDTFEGSLACLAFCGMLVNFGQSSGAMAPLALSRLAERSLKVARPMLFHYIRERRALEAMAAEMFAALANGAIEPRIALRLPLADAAEAHRALESRSTSGSIVLIP